MRKLFHLSLLLFLSATASSGQVPDSATIAGLRWRAVGPVNMAGRITAIAAEPGSNKVFYVAGATGGIWKTVNAGTSFVPLWEKEAIASLGDIAVASSDHRIIWVGTGEEDSRNSVAPGWGVYKSVDGGITWQSVGLEKTQHIGRIVIHPTNPEIVWVAALGAQWATNPDRGLYKTTDGGKNWKLVKFISNQAGFIDLAMDPRDPNTLYASSWERIRKPSFFKSGGPGSALWKSTDGGETWTEIKGGGFPATAKGRISIAIAPSNPDVVYTMVEADSVKGAQPSMLLSGLYRSGDAGRTWTWVNTTNNRPFYFSQIRVDPRNPDRIYRTAVDFAVSEDGGRSWRTGMAGIHEDYHAMWIDPADPDHFVVGGDAGIFQTWDRGGTYDALNNMPMAQFYGISYDYQVPYRICGGMQDNGTSCGLSRRNNAPLQMTDWFAVFAADGLQSAQDPFDPDFVYYESQGGNMSRRNLATGEVVSVKPRTVTRTQFGQAIQRIRGDVSKPATSAQQKSIDSVRAEMRRQLADPNAATRWNWNTPFVLSRHDANVFYSGAEKLFKSVKRGIEPVAISGDLTTANEAVIRMTTGYDSLGNVAADATGGITRDATGAEENATIVTIGESGIRPGLLYVGTNDGKVWLTRNDGATWEDLTGRFPGVPAGTYMSKVEPGYHDSATVFVSFDNHRENDFKPYVYVSTDFGKTFRSLAAGIPTDRPNSVYVIRQDPVNAKLLYVGTELGVSASLDLGQTWFALNSNLPTVPVYDLQVHPRDRELIAGTHGRAIQVLSVAPLQQMTVDVLARGAYLFEPAVALQYGERPVASEPRAQRPWRSERTQAGTTITYRLTSPLAQAPQVLVINVAGDTIARLTGPNAVGLNTVNWNLMVGGAQGGGFAGGFGGGAGGRGMAQAAADIRDPGFPPGFNSRPAESRSAPDSNQTPEAVRQRLSQPGTGGSGGPGGGFGGFGSNRPTPVLTGDYRLTLVAGGQTMSQTVRVVSVSPTETSVLVPARR